MIEDNGAIIDAGELPEMTADAGQLAQVFQICCQTP
jgi:hypothetical protein